MHSMLCIWTKVVKMPPQIRIGNFGDLCAKCDIVSEGILKMSTPLLPFQSPNAAYQYATVYLMQHVNINMRDVFWST